MSITLKNYSAPTVKREPKNPRPTPKQVNARTRNHWLLRLRGLAQTLDNYIWYKTISGTDKNSSEIVALQTSRGVIVKEINAIAVKDNTPLANWLAKILEKRNEFKFGPDYLLDLKRRTLWGVDELGLLTTLWGRNTKLKEVKERAKHLEADVLELNGTITPWAPKL